MTGMPEDPEKIVHLIFNFVVYMCIAFLKIGNILVHKISCLETVRPNSLLSISFLMTSTEHHIHVYHSFLSP